MEIEEKSYLKETIDFGFSIYIGTLTLFVPPLSSSLHQVIKRHANGLYIFLFKFDKRWFGGSY